MRSSKPNSMPLLRVAAVLLAGMAQAALLSACGESPGSPPADGGSADVLTRVPPTSGAAPTAGVPSTGDDTTTSTPQATPKPRSGTIRGHVRDDTGAAVRDASVYITTATALVPEMAVFTDVAGAYVWRVPAGTFTVEVSRDGFETAAEEVTVAAGEEVRADFTLTSKGGQ